MPEVVIKNDTCGETGLFPDGHFNAASKSRDNNEIFYKKTTPRPDEQML